MADYKPTPYRRHVERPFKITVAGANGLWTVAMTVRPCTPSTPVPLARELILAVLGVRDLTCELCETGLRRFHPEPGSAADLAGVRAYHWGPDGNLPCTAVLA